MKQRKENYFIKINPELLFDINNKFESFYAPLVYAYLKLDYNNYIFNFPNKFYKIDRKPIIEFFGFDKGTLSKVFDQLIEAGLLEEKGREYRLLNDKDIYPYVKREEEGQLPEFVQIYNNFFIDFVELLNRDFESLKKKRRSLMKVIEIFYYLITKNSHMLLDQEVVNSKENIKSINKSLHHDKDEIEKHLVVLETIGFIELDGSGTIKTKYNLGTVKPNRKTNLKLKSKAKVEPLYDYEEQVNIPEQHQPESERINESVVPNHPESERIFESDKPTSTIKELYANQGVPVTEKEMLKYIEIRSRGDKDKFIDSIIEHKISIESVREYCSATS